jgi:four helix bundle protein
MTVAERDSFPCGMTDPPVRDFRDLKVWQKAIDLAELCDLVCDALPPARGYLAVQIRKAANSVHANIAEGNGRRSRVEYLRFLAIANGSLREVESHLHFVARRYKKILQVERALACATVTGKLLVGLTRSLSSE